jgi:CO/xanthine dehydrogenase Mo-binding subunit
LTIIAPCQNTFAFRLIIADLFDLPYSKVRLSSPAIGGAFGGKLEVCVEPVAALLSKLAGQPVKLELTRRETIIATRVRHASENHLCTGFSNDGTIQAIDCLMYTNTGAYASSAMNVAGALSHKLLLPYTVRNVRITVIPVYTNTIIAGAMRGYGSPQLFFGLERQIEEIAHILGVDNTEIQLKNMVDPDSLNSLSGEPIGNPRPKDCLVKAMELMDYQAVKEEEQKSKEEPGRYAIGVGVALGVHGNNCFGVHRDNTTPMIRMNEDGSCTLVTGAHDMGNDVLGMQMQIISDVIGVSMDKISVVAADTDTCLWHIGDYSSRGVFVIGSAAKNTAEKLRRELQIEAGKLLDTDPEMIELHDDAAWVKGNTGCTVSLRDVMTNCQAVSGRELCVYETYEAPRGAASYGVHMAKVSIDRETGKVSILSYVAVHDVGFIINPMMLEGQLEGGIHMGLGYGLSEKITFDEQGKPSPLVLKRYGVLRATDMPSHLKVGFVADKGGEPGGPYGAKAMGECPVVPVAPAVVNAIRNALDMEINDLPADKEKILQVLHQQAGRG